MKKLFILALAALMITLHSSAKSAPTINDGSDDSVVQYVHDNATKMVWTVFSNFNVANFTKDGYRMKAFFDEDNRLVSTVRYLKNRNELPLAALGNLDREYSRWDIVNLFEEQGLEKEKVYYAKISDGSSEQILKIRGNGKLSKFKM
ncbi:MULTISPECIES: hypothetical protein [Chitinophagaceae]